jgi:endoglycosylceramidase
MGQTRGTSKVRVGLGFTVALLVVAATATSAGAGALGSAGRAVTPTTAVGDVVTLPPLSTSSDRRIVDDQGRDVLLRGANVNSLGEYWQGVPSIPATIALTPADWDSMAAHGFSVIRLLISWSRVEPTRGVFDQAYLDQVDAYVRAAAAHGIYSVIDMHQDAYTATIATTDPSLCGTGTSPAKGWDGAPAWATLTDGLSTCVTGDRNSSPAVNRAWNNFYDNVDGIRDEFAAAWRAVAERFAGRPEVAGYDLLNEPETSRPAADLQEAYDALIRSTVLAIRAGEAGAAFEHIVIVEPAIPAGDPTRGIVIPNVAAIGLGTANVVGSVHNYAESITTPGLDLTIEAMNGVILGITTSLGVATWTGEYGFWDTDPATLAKVHRYAADEDKNLIGGAWWQWRQSCGDPHAVQWQGNSVVAPGGQSTQLNLLGCPDNTDLGPNDAFLDVLGRAYPRATPGRLVSLTSDWASGALEVHAKAGTSDVGKQIEVWAPTVDDATHRVTVQGLTDVTQHAVPGGRLIVATVTAPGAYALASGTALPPPGNTPAAPATAVTANPTFTG